MALAANYDVKAITNDSFDNFIPQINDSGQIVWCCDDGNDMEIYLYDIPTSSMTQITNNNYADVDPLINNKGQIVWHNVNYDDHEIFFYDPTTSTTKQITDNNYDDMWPQINNNGQVVWFCSDGNDFEIFLYDPAASSTTQLTNNSYDDKIAQINDKGQIAWSSYDGNDSEIYLYDIPTSSTTQITNNDYNDAAPEINNKGQIVWRFQDLASFNSTYGIKLFDPATSSTKQIIGAVGDGHNCQALQINNNGQVAAVIQIVTQELYLYDIATSSTRKIADVGPAPCAPKINDQGQIVWESLDVFEQEIYTYDPVTCSITRITNNDVFDYCAQINEHGQIVWHGGYFGAGTDYEIFLATPITQTDYTPPTTTINFSGSSGNNGWFTSDIEVNLTANDEENGSGLDKTEYSFDGGLNWITYSNPFTVSSEGTATISYRSVDKAGNIEQVKTQDVKVDKTAPTVTINGPLSEKEYLLNQSVAASWTASDNIAGIDSEAGTVISGELVDTKSVGKKTFTVTAKDKAGNETQLTMNYYVRYSFGSFLCPLNKDGKTFYRGLPVPIRFQLKDAQSKIVRDAIVKIYVAPVVNGQVGQEKPATPLLIPCSGNTCVFSKLLKQYVYDLNTSRLSKGTWRIRVDLGDGCSKYVNVVLK
jgi:Tol biopolymer transport system component